MSLKKRAKAQSQIPWKNKSPTGFWIASYLERCKVKGENRTNPRRRCLAWENTIIFQARDREAAYRKAIRLGRNGNTRTWYRTGLNGQGKARWVFEGLTDLLPVYDDLEDGAELFYRAHHSRSVATIKKLVKPKRSLSVFRDAQDAV
jgi:Domain of unknown function (DUF4288)